MITGQTRAGTPADPPRASRLAPRHPQRRPRCCPSLGMSILVILKRPCLAGRAPA